MITDIDKEKIREISKRYSAKRVLLFGSSLASEKESRDIDIAVEGVSPEEFYRYYGDLLFTLSKSVDVINLSGTSKFMQLVRKEGVVIYG